MTPINPEYHPVYLFQSAYVIAEDVWMSKKIDKHDKDRWYGRIQVALEALLIGVKFTINEDGSYHFKPRPGSTRTEEERAGHTIFETHTPSGGKTYVCACMAGQHGNLCWGRAARAMLEYLRINETPKLEDEDMFDDPDEVKDATNNNTE